MSTVVLPVALAAVTRSTQHLDVGGVATATLRDRDDVVTSEVTGCTTLRTPGLGCYGLCHYPVPVLTVASKTTGELGWLVLATVAARAWFATRSTGSLGHEASNILVASSVLSRMGVGSCDHVPVHGGNHLPVCRFFSCPLIKRPLWAGAPSELVAAGRVRRNLYKEVSTRSAPLLVRDAARSISQSLRRDRSNPPSTPSTASGRVCSPRSLALVGSRSRRSSSQGVSATGVEAATRRMPRSVKGVSKWWTQRQRPSFNPPR